jgi:hypothetical protein
MSNRTVFQYVDLLYAYLSYLIDHSIFSLDAVTFLTVIAMNLMGIETWVFHHLRQTLREFAAFLKQNTEVIMTWDSTMFALMVHLCPSLLSRCINGLLQSCVSNFQVEHGLILLAT